MTSTSSMNRALRSTAVLATLALLATLLSGVVIAGPANAGPGYQKPKVGQCRNLTGAQSRANTNSTKPISCASTHTAQTVGVGKLSARLAKSSKKRIKEAQASKCQKLFNEYVGRSAAKRAKSAFALRIFNPTKAQKKKGARWFRCDAVLPRGKSLAALTTSGKPLLSSPTPASQALCQTSGGSATTCDVTHSYKATAAFKLKGKKFPGKKSVKKDAKKGCNSRITGPFRYDAPSKADWAVKKKHVVCFDGHTLPPAVVNGPATTLEVPSGGVPTGTNVRIEGVATDDISVASITATVRNAAGLYLQDNLTTFSSTSNTLPITITSGALGSASASWRLPLGSAVPIGSQTVTVTVKDNEGNPKVVTDTLLITAAPDTTMPTVSLSGTQANITTAVSLVISGTASDNVQVANLVVQLKRNSDGELLQDDLTSFATTNANGLPVNPTGLGTSSVSFGLDTGPRSIGTYTVEVTATDSSGNPTNPPIVTKTVTVATPTGGSQVYYAMNEGGGATTMEDTGSSGLNRDGTINQSGLDTGLPDTGGNFFYRWLYTSPTAPPAKPQRVIQVPDNPALDAGSDTFTVEVRYRTDESFGNVMQKGQSGSVGGQWKIQQPGGYPSCLFKRRSNNEDFQISVQSTVDFRAGSWHTLKCVRSGNNVTMFVDGVYNGQKNFGGVGELGTPGSVGTINNSVPLTIGGKLNCDQIATTCDYFTGDIDYVRLTHS